MPIPIRSSSYITKHSINNRIHFDYLYLHQMIKLNFVILRLSLSDSIIPPIRFILWDYIRQFHQVLLFLSFHILLHYQIRFTIFDFLNFVWLDVIISLHKLIHGNKFFSNLRSLILSISSLYINYLFFSYFNYIVRSKSLALIFLFLTFTFSLYSL